MARQEPLVKQTGFAGINNVLKPENTPPEFLKEAVNVDIDKAGNIHKRDGYSLVSAGNYQSIWANGDLCYAVKDNDLIRINADYTESTLKPDTGALDFTELNGLIYFTSDTANGVIDNGVVREWGIDIPNPPTLSKVSGLLPAGDYQVTYTWIRPDGMESGAPVASVITVPDSSGISVTIPVSGYDARVYASNHNGTELFYSGDSQSGMKFFITSVSKLSNPLKMFNLARAPYGETPAYFKGRVYICDGNSVWYSEPLQYEHFNLDSNYLDMEHKVIGLMPVDDGMWIATEGGLYFAFGTNPFNLMLKEAAVMVKGTNAVIPMSYLKQSTGYFVAITTDKGVFLLGNTGYCGNLTSTNLSLEKASTGTAEFVEQSGANQYISILKKTGEPNNSVFGDIVSSEIIRNGVALPN